MAEFADALRIADSATTKRLATTRGQQGGDEQHRKTEGA